MAVSPKPSEIVCSNFQEFSDTSCTFKWHKNECRNLSHLKKLHFPDKNYSFRVKMSYGKDEFLDWDDEGLDLGALPGEYSCSEVDPNK